MADYQYRGIGIPDKEFIRGQIPMTKENIRVLSVAKLQLQEDSVVYDIGAGTGSVTVEMAHICRKGKVYAIEQKMEGCDLILQNAEKFQLENVVVCHGSAPECLEELEPPTHVFVGGSSGKLADIVEAVRRKNANVKFVINAVTLETLSALLDLNNHNPACEDMELIEVSVANCKLIGTHHMLQGENPVYIASFS